MISPKTHDALAVMIMKGRAILLYDYNVMMFPFLYV
jgi:hypothetical protein